MMDKTDLFQFKLEIQKEKRNLKDKIDELLQIRDEQYHSVKYRRKVLHDIENISRRIGRMEYIYEVNDADSEVDIEWKFGGLPTD